MSSGTPGPSPLKPIEVSVLLVLAEREDYGYRIVKRIAAPDAGGIGLAPSNLYSVLDRMIDAGWVEDLGTRKEGTRPVRRYYGITTEGRQVVASEARRMRSMVDSAARLSLLPEAPGA
jgi:DNA-binding PadR family transcriptional regulator